MTFLPVVHRELQIAARQRRTHWMRVSAPVIAFGVLFVMAGTSINWQDKDKVGQNSFHMISGLTMVYCLLVGMWATSDCLSRERREGTLGLLFLTDLSGADVVLGKLAASSTRMFYGLIAVFPILGVPLLLGGVTIGEYGRMCLVLMGGMFLSLSIGMFASSLCRSAEASMGTAFGLLFVLSVILPSWHFSFLGAHPSDWGVIFLSPTLGLILTLEKLNISDPASFWIWLALNQLLCWSLLQFACRRSVASRIEKKAAARRTPTKQEENELRYQSLLNTHKRRHLLDINPILWLVTRQRLRQKAIWLFVCVIILVPVFFLPIMGRNFFDPSMCLFLILGSHGVIKAWAASEAANLIVENRKNETFELLSSTRLTGADFFDGQLIAIRRQFRAPILTILTFDCLMIIGMWGTMYSIANFNYYAITWFLLGSMAFLIFETETVARVSLWQGLTVSKPNKASGHAFSSVVTLPCVFFLIIVLFTSMIGAPMMMGIVLWWFVGIFVNFFFREKAKEGLTARITQLETI